MEEGEGFHNVLRALRDAARRVEAGELRGPALQALLALEAGADDLLAGDPDLTALRRLLSRLRALSSSLDLCSDSGSLSLRARCRRCGARRAVARVAGAVAGEIQAWVDREAIAHLVAALRGGRADAARALLAELEARLRSAGGQFDPRLQAALLRHGVFPAVEAGLGDPAVGDGCAAAVLALVRFNKDVFVGPVLMGPAVGALVASASGSPAPLPPRALNGLVDAIRSPLVDELHARGELPRLVALLCAPDPRPRARLRAPRGVLRPQGGGGRAPRRGPREAPPLPAALRPQRLARGHGHGRRRGRLPKGEARRCQTRRIPPHGLPPPGVAASRGRWRRGHGRGRADVRERGGAVRGAGGGGRGAEPAGEARDEAGDPTTGAGGGRVAGGGGHRARRGALGRHALARSGGGGASFTDDR